MRVNLKGAFESILRWGEAPDKRGVDPVSMVLLLREPRFSTLDQLRSAAGRAFGTSFTGDKGVTTLRSSSRPVNSRKPYGDDSHNFGRSLPEVSQRQAWTEHTAWTAVDYVKGGADLELEYAVLARLCIEMLDMNCVGLYVPGKRTLIPNDG